jgi:hypothetical protein
VDRSDLTAALDNVFYRTPRRLTVFLVVAALLFLASAFGNDVTGRTAIGLSVLWAFVFIAWMGEGARRVYVRSMAEMRAEDAAFGEEIRAEKAAVHEEMRAVDEKIRSMRANIRRMKDRTRYPKVTLVDGDDGTDERRRQAPLN